MGAFFMRVYLCTCVYMCVCNCACVWGMIVCAYVFERVYMSLLMFISVNTCINARISIKSLLEKTEKNPGID